MVKPPLPANGSGWGKIGLTPPAFVSRRVPILAGIVLIAAGFLGVIHDYDGSALHLRRRQLLSDEAAADRFARSLNAIMLEEGSAGTRARRAYDDAVAATINRHQLARDLRRATLEAEREKRDVGELGAALNDETAIMKRWIVAYETRYGSSSTRRLRADLTALSAARATEIRSWTAAVDEVIAATRPGVPGSRIDVARVARNYADATSARSQTQSEARTLQTDLEPLVDRVKDDLNTRREAYQAST